MKENRSWLVAVKYIGVPIGNCMTVCLVGKGAPAPITIQPGCYGLIDVANPHSGMMADYWYAVWLIKDAAGRVWGGFKSVQTNEVMPIWPKLIKPKGMKLLLAAHRFSNKPAR